MDDWIKQLLLPVILCCISSTGLWAYLSTRDKTKDAFKKLLMGMAYNVIIERGMSYIDRGSKTRDEYEDLRNYFYDPYKTLGGNGVAEQIMEEVARLPFKNPSLYFELKPSQVNQEYRNDGWQSQGFNQASSDRS